MPLSYSRFDGWRNAAALRDIFIATRSDDYRLSSQEKVDQAALGRPARVVAGRGHAQESLRTHWRRWILDRNRVVARCGAAVRDSDANRTMIAEARTRGAPFSEFPRLTP